MQAVLSFKYQLSLMFSKIIIMQGLFKLLSLNKISCNAFSANNNRIVADSPKCFRLKEAPAVVSTANLVPVTQNTPHL